MIRCINLNTAHISAELHYDDKSGDHILATFGEIVFDQTADRHAAIRAMAKVVPTPPHAVDELRGQIDFVIDRGLGECSRLDGQYTVLADRLGTPERLRLRAAYNMMQEDIRADRMDGLMSL